MSLTWPQNFENSNRFRLLNQWQFKLEFESLFQVDLVYKICCSCPNIISANRTCITLPILNQGPRLYLSTWLPA